MAEHTTVDPALAGGFGTCQNSARAGYLPISLRHVPSSVFRKVAIYLRSGPDCGEGPQDECFTLYRGPEIVFKEHDRERLLGGGVRFVYIRIADQSRFREQMERSITDTASDQSMAIAEKSTIVYETSLELINELLSEPDLAVKSAQLENISRAITTLVLSDATAFSHLFTASHHDFYTATHMVNVATWMVPIAYAMGYRDSSELTQICQAGLLHDIGKMYIPEELLNKRGGLSPAEWDQIRHHPVLGGAYLESCEKVPALAAIVARQHHERLDGGGYPQGLRAAQIDPISRICAVADCFDAMTAFRPFKERTLSVAEAVEILKADTPQQFDAKVLQVWLDLLSGVDPRSLMPEELSAQREQPTAGRERRGHERFNCCCPARVHVLLRVPEGLHEEPGLPVTIHSVSRFGLGFLSHSPLPTATPLRIYLLGRDWAGKVVHGKAVRCRRYQDGWYEIGVALWGGDGDGAET